MSRKEEPEDIPFEEIRHLSKETALAIKDAEAELAALSGKEREELVKELAAYMAANPDAEGMAALKKNGSYIFQNAIGIATALLPAHALMSDGNAATVGLGIIPALQLVLTNVYKQTGNTSPLHVLIHEAERVADTIRKENDVPLEHKIKPEYDHPVMDYALFGRNIPNRALTAKTADYLHQTETTPQQRKQSLMRKFSVNLLTGIALTAATAGCTDLVENLSPERDAQEKNTHLIVDLTALAALGAGSYVFRKWQKGFAPITPADQLLFDARQYHGKMQAEQNKGLDTEPPVIRL